MGDRMRLPDGMGAPMGADAEVPEQQAAEPDYTIPYEDLREWIAQADPADPTKSGSKYLMLLPRRCT